MSVAVAALLVTLAIPDRPQHASSPPSGWCGETAIQEALLHYGVWAPQSLVHAAGKSKHPDLYADELPTALAALGVQYTKYAPKKAGYAPFREWVASAIDGGAPVIAGVKLLPTQHPDWGLDHFVLAVGHDKDRLLLNTTWGEQRWADDTATKGISLKNAFYALRIDGVSVPKGARAARLVVEKETAKTVEVTIECEKKERRTIDATLPARFVCPV